MCEASLPMSYVVKIPFVRYDAIFRARRGKIRKKRFLNTLDEQVTINVTSDVSER